MHKGSYPIDEVFFALCKEADTPISLSAWLRYKYDPRSILELAMPIRDYREKDSLRFALDYNIVSFLSKWKGLGGTKIELRDRALSKFAASEVSCLEANRRIRASRSSAIDADLSSRLFRAKVKIAKLLGPFSLHCISPFFGWGPGATYDIPRRRALVDTKMTEIPMTVAPKALDVLKSVIRIDRHWSLALQELISANPGKPVFAPTSLCRVTTVPKSSKTDRVIAIEPTGNLFLQKGVGGYFRRRLRRVGIDLDNQGINQALAAEALSQGLATLDLSAASDSVSRELVYELLPLDWASFMDAIRSPLAEMPDGSVVRLEKFSSMGNGFTFELETLLFWALSASVLEDVSPGGVLAVYGDDIIVPQSCYRSVVELLAFVGFSVNSDKSFADGLFFESCGKHYFGGVEVTPCYQKEVLSNDYEIIRCHNRLVRWSQRIGTLTNAPNPLRRNCFDKKSESCVLPYGVDADDGFLTDLDDVLGRGYRVDRSRGYRGIKVRVTTSYTRSLPAIEQAFLALWFRRTDRDSPTEKLVYNQFEDSLPYTGDVTIAAEKTAVRTTTYGWRWVVPPGFCLLYRM